MWRPSGRRTIIVALAVALLWVAVAQGAAAAKVIGVGKFGGLNGYDVSGRHKIVSVNGKKYLRLKRSFRSDGGPGLKVWLSKAKPKAGDAALKKSYLNLGSLKKATGKQSYRIPAGKKIAPFDSVVIWCTQAVMAFGTAPIKSP
jgi:Electron transfer DM13